MHNTLLFSCRFCGWKHATRLLGLVQATLLCAGSASASFSLSDDFNDHTLNSDIWTVFKAGEGPNVKEHRGWLEIMIPADSHGSGSGPTYGPHDFGAGYITCQAIRGDFDVQVAFTLLDWPADNGVRSGVGLNLFFTAVERTSLAPQDYAGFGGEFYLTHFLDGVQGLVPTVDQAGKLRVTRVGNLMSGYYWNGHEWSLIHQGPGPTADGLVSIVAWSHDQYFRGQDVKLAFDDFQLIADAEGSIPPTPVPEPGTFLGAALLLLPFAVRVLQSRHPLA